MQVSMFFAGKLKLATRPDEDGVKPMLRTISPREAFVGPLMPGVKLVPSSWLQATGPEPVPTPVGKKCRSAGPLALMVTRAALIWPMGAPCSEAGLTSDVGATSVWQRPCGPTVLI